MSLTPVTRNFASVTRRVFRDRVVFSGGASSHFASSKCFRVGDAKTRKRSRLPSSANNHNTKVAILPCTVHGQIATENVKDAEVSIGPIIRTATGWRRVFLVILLENTCFVGPRRVKVL